jgi:hypothetical protein
VIGGSDVWREARHRSRLLIVEKNYVFSSAHRSIGNLATESVARYGKFSCTKNPLDETIENVLKYGGDVELVDSNVLRRYDHIALIK